MYKTITYPCKQKWITIQFDAKKEFYRNFNKATTHNNKYTTTPSASSKSTS